MTPVADRIRRGLEAHKEMRGARNGLIRFLVGKGVARPLAHEIAMEFFQEGADVPQLCAMLKQRICVAPPPPMPHVVALVGSPGVGKTTTLLKLASSYLHQDLRIALMTLEPNPILEGIAQHWKVPLWSQWQEDEVDGVLIDTPGTNAYQASKVEELGERLAEFPITHTLLTLSATTKDLDTYGAIHQFSALPLSGLVFTKLDETLAGGILLNVCQKTTLPLTYIAYGYPLPGKIEVADAESIVTKILTDFNRDEFMRIRQLIIE